MTRFASKFGIAAALTLVAVSAAAAQVRPTTTSTVSKGEVAKVDTVRITDTVTVTNYRRDTITVAGPTVVRYDTTIVETLPGWMGVGHGVYFGLGAGSYYPSAGLGGGQIPGYAFQANLGWDAMSNPFGIRLTTQLARPDESQNLGAAGARPTIWNSTLDLKLRVPAFSSTMFPHLGLYAVGGGAYVRGQDVRYTTEATPTAQKFVVIDQGWHDSWGYSLGGGATLALGHKRELFLEARVINYSAGDNLENAHQFPLILGINWY
jgi:hypothetical protein